MVANPRLLALQALLSIETEQCFANLALRNILSKSLSGVDKALLIQLVYGAVSMKLAIDYQLNRLLKKPVDTLSAPVRNILRLGAYQLMYLEKIPARAAVDEAVKLAHKYGHPGTVGLVNAVLRRLSEIGEFSWPSGIAEGLSVRYSHPDFLVKRYLTRLGEAETQALLAVNNLPPRFSIRANRTVTSAEALAHDLKELGVKVDLGEYVEGILYPTPTPPFDHDLFLQGHYIVQGEASAMCGLYLAPQPQETVVDLCAAPGGKTTHLAELMGDSGRVLAFDINERRLQLVTENAQRLRLRTIETYARPAQEAMQVVRRADRVLLDAPCSGFGVLRHKPDIRWQRSEDQIRELSALQRELIACAAELVKPGGRLVYSVCTTEPEETTDVVRYLLSERQDFVLAEPPALRKKLPVSPEPGHFFWPHRDNIDGFYIVALTRTAGN